MAENTTTHTTNNADGSVTTVTITYDDKGNETSRSTCTSAGSGSVVGIQAGTVNGGVVFVHRG